ncbi:MAG: DUF4105 domain-containing protein [Bacteroidota bacterium]
MRTYRFALLICFAFPLLASGQRVILPPTLTETAEVSVITCGPGNLIYEIFGHSAFRVRDPQLRLDWVYNYGTFEYGPDYVPQFLRGKLRYFLNSYAFNRFLVEYQKQNRIVKEQVLDLKTAEKQAVYDYLNTNRLDDNKYYQYDFFYDNCATRERDVLLEVLGDNLRFRPATEDTLGTLRDMIHVYFAVEPWASFGVDLCLGLPADKPATQLSAMFLPDYLFEGLRAGEVDRNGNWQPLVKREVVLFDPGAGFALTPPAFRPLLLMWIIFGVGVLLTVTTFGRKRIFRLFDSLLFFLIGFLGVVVLLFWFGTDHDATYNNLNILWLIPTHLLFAGLIWFRKLERWIAMRYATWFGLYYIVFLLVSFFLPQYFHPAMYPLVLLMIARFMLYRFQSMD